MKVYFKSEKQTWETPQEIFEELDREFNFTLDVAASESNRKCYKFFDETVNGLIQTWSGNCYCNPPYNNAAAWVEKAFTSVKNNDCNLVVMLIPARTGTRYWHNYIWDNNTHTSRKNVEVRFLKGRLKFEGAKHIAPFTSAVVIFRSEKQTLKSKLSNGAVLTHRKRTKITEQKIIDVISQLQVSNKKITKSSVADLVDISREQISRRYSHLFD